jgi:hypothetical protein
LENAVAVRDEAIHLAEAREAARIRTMFAAARQATKFDRREADYQRQIQELHEDVHRLNNIIDLILSPALVVVEEGPNVLIVEDDGMEVDVDAKPEEDEEVEPWEDDHGDGVSDVDSDHSEA